MKSVKMNFAWELLGDRHFSLPATNMILMWNIVVLLPGAATCSARAILSLSALLADLSSIIVWSMRRTLRGLDAKFHAMRNYVNWYFPKEKKRRTMSRTFRSPRCVMSFGKEFCVTRGGGRDWWKAFVFSAIEWRTNVYDNEQLTRQ